MDEEPQHGRHQIHQYHQNIIRNIIRNMSHYVSSHRFLIGDPTQKPCVLWFASQVANVSGLPHVWQRLFGIGAKVFWNPYKTSVGHSSPCYPTSQKKEIILSFVSLQPITGHHCFLLVKLAKSHKLVVWIQPPSDTERESRQEKSPSLGMKPATFVLSGNSLKNNRNKKFQPFPRNPG